MKLKPYLTILILAIFAVGCVTTYSTRYVDTDSTIKAHQLAEERTECGALHRQAVWFSARNTVKDDGWGNETNWEDWKGFAYCKAYDGEDIGSHCGSVCADGCSQSVTRDRSGTYLKKDYNDCLSECVDNCVNYAGSPSAVYCPDTIPHCKEKRDRKNAN